MSNIIDKIQLSGVTYDIGGSGSVSTAITSGDTNAVAGGAVYDKFDEVEQVTARALIDLNDALSGKQDTLSAGTNITISGNVISASGGSPTVELTQAEYDALVTAGTVSADTYYIITDATPVDMSNYYTTAQTNSLLSGKQNTLVSGTNIKTINNESILGSGNISVEGKGVVGSESISVLTGTTDYTINFTPSIWAGTGANSIKENYSSNTASGSYSHAEGYSTKATGSYSHAEGSRTTAGAGSYTHAEGYNTTAGGNFSHAEGNHTVTYNDSEHASGRYNVSSKANITFGDSGNTLFSVGNGTGDNARHNAFEIRQNGDIYLSSGGTDIKLQDHLGGGGSGTVSSAITSGDTNAVAGGAVYDRFNEVEQVTAQALNVLNDRVTEDEEVTAAAFNNLNEALSGKQDTLSAGTNITIVDNVISAEGGGGTVSSAITSGDTNAVAGGAVFDAVVYSGNTYNTELTFDANGYAENWVVGQSAITIDVSGYTSDTSADYYFKNSNGEDLGYAHIHKTIGFWGGNWNNDANNCTITTDGDTATTATITDIPSGTVKIRRRGEMNPPKAIISGDTPEIWIKDALDDHRDNTTVHITAAERTSWNNKSNFSGSYNDLTDKPIPDSALTSYSTNAVQSKTLYDELRINNGGGETETTLTFEGEYSTNYPNGCTKLKVEVVGDNNWSSIDFYDDNQSLGNIVVNYWGSISVDNHLDGATYEISGTTLIISYPTVTNVTKIQVRGSGNYVYKAVTTGTPTALKDQVVANTTALGGLSLVKLTQQQYDALATKDNSTLYVIVG